jgi:1-phosphofructokinase
MFATLTLNPAFDCTLTVEGDLTPGAVHTVASETRTPGGKGVNVAKMLASNGMAVRAGGLLGSGDRSAYEEALRAVGIEPQFLAVPGHTRSNLMIAGRAAEMKFNRPGFPGLCCDQPELERYVSDLTEDCEAVILSGSLPARFAPDTYARLVQRLKRSGRTVVLDASGPPLVAGVAAGPDILKPNRLELEQLAGRTLATDEAVESAIRTLSARHMAVIVSDGSRGGWFASGGILLRGVPPDVLVRDTTGAGDSLLGQFCADFFPERRLTPLIAARALAAGAAAVEQPGTPQIPLSRVIALAARVAIRPCRA